MAWNEQGPGNRDPWGKGPKNDAPDLDEMLKRFKERLKGKGGGNGPSSPLPAVGLWKLAIPLVALLWLASGFFVVDEQEQAVVFRFGAYSSTVNPGLRWRMPWPIERHERVSFTMVRTASDDAQMLTKDENIIDLKVSVQYRVKSTYNVLMSLSDPDRTLRQALRSSVREVVGQNSMDFILTDGRQAVSERIKQLLQERLEEYKSGLTVNEVNLQQVQAPDEVRGAFNDAIKAREDLERQKNEAEAYANEKLPKARGAAARELAEAAAYRDQIIAKAEGEASRFSQLLTEYKKAPGVTRDRLYLETLGKVYRSNSKVLVDIDKGSPMIYLPLDQLIKAQSASKAAPEAANSVPAPQPSTQMPMTEDLRSRDRSAP